MNMSDSLNLVYRWAEGSLPPPGHYEYRIEVVNLSGKITFFPDYPQNDFPGWIDDFQCTSESLSCLYEKLDSVKFFTKRWRSRDPFRIGGSTQSLEITLYGRSAVIPYDLAYREQQTLQPVIDAVKELVPRLIWERLMALRENYIQEHYG